MGQVVGNIIVQKRGVVSLGLLKEHNIPLNDGDIFQVQIEDGKVILIPMKLIPADQTWFWTSEWQKGEKEAEEDVVAGKVKSFENVEDLLKDLDQ
ncbi:AbrB/MazE/SpoVT family DNA-binding domain-containing protein [Desulfoscipio sp. XC116]|uniref:AbrB/MazE/SpoVT family DNA-binding domain-containing protein n=1 Tax=Desulfoscipio sp. XC116 TaxID=3144975 RepID=UPI00325B48E5